MATETDYARKCQQLDVLIDLLERENKRLQAERRRWIPCKERLPEKEGWYITTVENEKTGKRRIENDLFAISIAIAHGNKPHKFCKDGYGQRTIAWQPFPEPYKKSEVAT